MNKYKVVITRHVNASNSSEALKQVCKQLNELIKHSDFEGLIDSEITLVTDAKKT